MIRRSDRPVPPYPSPVEVLIGELDELLGESRVGRPPGAHPTPWHAQPTRPDLRLAWTVTDARGETIARTTEPIALLLERIAPWFDEISKASRATDVPDDDTWDDTDEDD